MYPHTDADMGCLFCMSLAWKIFILARTMALILELVVTVGTRGCLQLRYVEFQQHCDTRFMFL